jgi:transcriptional regulator with XRE-family HTH domain
MYTEKGQELLDALEPKQLQRERVLEQAAYLVFLALDERGWSKADFARHLETSRSHVSQVLRGTRNVGLGTLSDMLFELDKKLEINAVPIAEAMAPCIPGKFDPPIPSGLTTTFMSIDGLEETASPSAEAALRLAG